MRMPQEQKVRLGLVGATRGVMGWAHEAEGRVEFLFASMGRHAEGDWGDVDDEDKAANDQAIKGGTRILSAYPVPVELRGTAPDDHMWIITEADRSQTTVLWPSEY